MTDRQPDRQAWHRALVYAITGQRLDDLGVQERPDLAVVADLIAERTPGGLDAVRDLVADRRDKGEPWPYPLPDELRSGLGAAQLVAALAELRRRLAVEPGPQRQLVSDRAPDADERRLLQDVPPHHGH